VPVPDPEPSLDAQTDPAGLGGAGIAVSSPFAAGGRPMNPSVLEDLRAYAEADAAKLDDLADLLDVLREQAGALADDPFDAERIWAHVERELFG